MLRLLYVNFDNLRPEVSIHKNVQKQEKALDSHNTGLSIQSSSVLLTSILLLREKMLKVILFVFALVVLIVKGHSTAGNSIIGKSTKECARIDASVSVLYFSFFCILKLLWCILNLILIKVLRISKLLCVSKLFGKYLPRWLILCEWFRDVRSKQHSEL